MIWTSKTHDCAATICPRLGKPCPAASRMLKALSDSMSAAKHRTDENFEMTGHGALTACAQGCTARFLASHRRIRVFCDADAKTAAQDLNLFADVMFDLERSTQALAIPLSARPLVMAQAIPRKEDTARPKPAQHPALRAG